MTEKELLSAFLSKTLNMDETGVASLYNEDGTELKSDALDTLLRTDVERVGKLKPDTKKFFDDGYKKAEGEIRTKIEKEFTEKTGFKSDKKGVDLFIEYAAKKQDGGEITEDVIKKHPVFINAVEKLSSEKEAAVQAEQKKLTDFQSELKNKEMFSSVASKAMDLFNGLKPILSSDEAKAKHQKEDFVSKLKGYEYDIQGDKVIVLKEGKVLEDEHGNRIPFEKIVKETANKYYDFHVTDPKSAPGNGKAGEEGGEKKKVEIVVPKNDKEYMAMVTDPSKTAEEQVAIRDAYKESQKGTN
jgi:hypothetical protein